jgi:hypothetical protein
MGGRARRASPEEHREGRPFQARAGEGSRGHPPSATRAKRRPAAC